MRRISTFTGSREQQAVSGRRSISIARLQYLLSKTRGNPGGRRQSDYNKVTPSPQHMKGPDRSLFLFRSFAHSRILIAPASAAERLFFRLGRILWIHGDPEERGYRHVMSVMAMICSSTDRQTMIDRVLVLNRADSAVPNQKHYAWSRAMGAPSNPAIPTRDAPPQRGAGRTRRCWWRRW